MVEASLPTGVIRNNTEAVSGDIEKIDTLTVEELAKLWRAYSTKQKLLANDVGRRLENFFWRIWSSDKIRTTIQGTQVAVIFEDISQGHIIRTTPTSSPRNSRLYAVAHRAQDARPRSPERGLENQIGNPPGPQRRPRPRQNPSTDTIVPRKNSDAIERDGEPSRPPPILKKPGSDYGTSNKTARIQPPAWKSGELDPDHDEPMSPAEIEAQRRARQPKFHFQEQDEEEDEELGLSPTTVISVGEPSPTLSQPAESPKMSRTGSGQGSSSGMRGKKKPSFVVSSSRRRPVINRRQSAQTTGGGSTKIISPGLKPMRRTSQDVTAGERNASPDQAVPSLELCVSRSHSPVSESPFRRTARDHEASERSQLPDAVHRKAAGLLAPKSQWMPLNDVESGDASTDMRRSTSASAMSLSSPGSSKARPASMSSSNLQAAGTMTPTQSASATATRQSMFGRASSLFKGKSKATFDIGPEETDSAAPSRRTSIEINPEQESLVSGFARSRSQSQLSGLLDQERKKDAQRDRTKSSTPGEQSGRKGKR